MASTSGTREALSRERVLQSALDLADADGLDALTMRRLADRLGVEAMSLYHHLPNKGAILDGVLELVFLEIERELGGFDVGTGGDGRDGDGDGDRDERADAAASAPTAPDAAPAAAGWTAEARRRILGARTVMVRHPWVPALMQSRGTTTFGIARYVDGLVGVMRGGGCSYDLTHHALHALGSRMFGFTQELQMDGTDAEGDDFTEMFALVPNLAAMVAGVTHDDEHLGWCDDQTEFEFSIDLLLDGLEGRRRAEASRGR